MTRSFAFGALIVAKFARFFPMRISSSSAKVQVGDTKETGSLIVLLSSKQPSLRIHGFPHFLRRSKRTCPGCE